MQRDVYVNAREKESKQQLFERILQKWPIQFVQFFNYLVCLVSLDHLILYTSQQDQDLVFQKRPENKHKQFKKTILCSILKTQAYK